ncbi:MAG: efflux RND transporter periplasmic adaptor subunit [Alphaproteobacteria bacterium]|nr:efflux RND transporter periplasmic adaptor subunit [Alphaproteobacteria bacterium]
MIKRMIIMLLLTALVLGGIFGYKIFEGMMIKKYMSAGGPPPQTVSTLQAKQESWQPKLEAVGSFRAVNGADISAEVPGIISTLSFESGADVEKDAVLVQLRAEDDIAKLHTLEAAARIADITYQRDLKQLAVQAVSQAVVDNDLATLDGARAQVAAQQALVDKKTIKAPFAGHLGIRQVDVGQYLNAGTAIVTLQQLDTLYVDFNLPETALPKISVGLKVTATVEAQGNAAFEGEISSINAKVDEGTRNIQVRATFKNADRKLLPGMFAKLSVETGAPVNFITLPQTAITYNPYGNTVYVIDSTDASKPVAKQTFVTLGDARGDQIAVTSGVKEGDEVVTSGQVKLRNGAAVIINNSVQPSNDAAPKPQDH